MMFYKQLNGKCYTTLIFLLLACTLYGKRSGIASITMINEQEVRFASGNTIYIEGLIDGEWVGRYWNADGQITLPYQLHEPAFEIQIKSDPNIQDGIALESGWQWVSGIELQEGDEEKRHFVIELSNKIMPIRIKVHTMLDGTAVLTRWLEVTNNGDKAIAITKCFPWSGCLWADDTAEKVGRSIRFDIGFEGWFGWSELKPGSNVFANHGGLTYDDPYFILPNQAGNEYFFGQLAWSANYQMEFEKGPGITFKIGPVTVDALRVISAGETVKTPLVHLGYTQGDFDMAVQAMHDHIRRSVIPDIKPERAYRIQCLAPEDRQTVYKEDNYNEANLKKILDVVDAVDMELFIVDGPTWAEGTTPSNLINPGFYGNWNARKSWFPNGLDPLREYAHERNIYFGLYAEPEGGRGDWSRTSAYQEHPEWFVPCCHQWHPGNNFLRISHTGAADYMRNAIYNEIIRRHKIDLYRHDQNGVEGDEGSVTEREGFKENDYWRHYEALFEIFKDVRNDFPDLILQQAAGGGAKMDLMITSIFNEHFTSDRTDFPAMFQMASGLSVFLPPEILVTANGMAGFAGGADLVTLLRSAFATANTPMIFNSVLPNTMDEMTPQFQETFLHYVKLYKEFIRPLLSTCKVYHHAPVSADGGVEGSAWFAMEYMLPDKTKGWATIVRFTEDPNYVFKAKGLDAQKTYKVTFDNSREIKTIKGSELMEKGLSLKIEGRPRSELLLFEQL